MLLFLIKFGRHVQLYKLQNIVNYFLPYAIPFKRVIIIKFFKKYFFWHPVHKVNFKEMMRMCKHGPVYLTKRAINQTAHAHNIFFQHLAVDYPAALSRKFSELSERKGTAFNFVPQPRSRVFQVISSF